MTDLDLEEPPVEYLKTIPARHGKTRPPDEVLDALLARIVHDRATPTGRELYARADNRTATQRAELRKKFPYFITAAGHTAYSNLHR